MAAIDEVPRNIVWVKRQNGWYESQCKRFSISRFKRGEYTVIDRAVKHAVIPEYNRTDVAYTIQHAKNIVARWLRNE